MTHNVQRGPIRRDQKDSMVELVPVIAQLWQSARMIRSGRGSERGRRMRFDPTFQSRT